MTACRILFRYCRRVEDAHDNRGLVSGRIGGRNGFDGDDRLRSGGIGYLFCRLLRVLRGGAAGRKDVLLRIGMAFLTKGGQKEFLSQEKPAPAECRGGDLRFSVKGADIRRGIKQRSHEIYKKYRRETVRRIKKVYGKR